tara:strand:+ start:136 stop:366 length:231 start_codon:yes stop_codon:yes gene_type:complete
MQTESKELNIELSLDRLESIVTKMESGEVSLEKSLILFEEGMNLIDECQSELKKAEQKVENLISEAKDRNESKEID